MSELERFDLSQSHFSLFGLPERFALDQTVLQSRYRELQARFHPDKFVAADPSAQRTAMQIASRLNEAYQTLRDPRLRAEYLLSLNNTSLDSERETLNDPDFLIKQMEWREAQEDAEHAPDPLNALDALRQKLLHERAGIIDRLEEHFEKKALIAAKNDVMRLSFYDRLIDQISERLSAIEDNLLT